MRLIRKTIIAVALLPGAAAAHPAGEYPVATSDLLRDGWTADPATLLPIAIAVGWYAFGVGRAMDEGRAAAISPGRTCAFAGGIGLLLLALQSPIDTISEDLFSVHMVQHLLLMLAAPPLLILSDCPIMFLRALPPRGRKLVARLWVSTKIGRGCELLMHPILVWILVCGTFVFWHAPGPYQWAVDNSGVHIVEHLSFFVSSLMFWALVLPIPHRRPRLAHGSALLLVVATAVLSGLPGALMIFSPRPLYPAHAAGVMKWGLTLMEDQQFAGLLMWIPAGGAYVLVVAWIFLEWLREGEARATHIARDLSPHRDG
jgi:putative membrane protein